MRGIRNNKIKYMSKKLDPSTKISKNICPECGGKLLILDTDEDRKVCSECPMYFSFRDDYQTWQFQKITKTVSYQIVDHDEHQKLISEAKDHKKKEEEYRKKIKKEIKDI